MLAYSPIRTVAACAFFVLPMAAALASGKRMEVHMTRIVVTHTLEEGLLRRYDQILALKDGRIAESGSFEELMARKGYFYSLYTVFQT